MDLLERISHNKKELYNLALEYFRNINPEQYEYIQFDKIVSKSIAVLIDHDFIPTPCIEIKLNVLQNQKEVVDYFLYINAEREFIDELLVMY
ncbi:hypothetical protein FLA105534_02873 [Flavobacterium bizetiae]|uniref:Uncharacterized protein n=1 Tax=Flavobacterium bizetiae TaxID=2704140 RepID=A0A6J4GL83_9FLAO|nr:hypothetical protein [Flavobacterium bizetiae]CAA9199927.1 hypothetical protein FLA105534_02873 [Flavobacterium bizetiae]CAD5343293.1 hypothetical protein FLA105535_03291 [Flavobacterium bizetiae]CAD5349607.1 hypothetical protein FLA105534_03593 [Flavobacterium bizetiae]